MSAGCTKNCTKNSNVMVQHNRDNAKNNATVKAQYIVVGLDNRYYMQCLCLVFLKFNA